MMSAKKKAKWVVIVVSILGLIISLMANFTQCHQNEITNERADRESARADSEAQTVKELQGKKLEWIAYLKAQLIQVENEILDTENKLSIENASSPLNIKEKEACDDRWDELSSRLRKLKVRKQELEEQISKSMSGN